MKDVYATIETIIDVSRQGNIESFGNNITTIAIEFAQLCETTNDRLSKIREYIDHDLWTSAIEENEIHPELLPLCKFLLEVNFDQWIEICKENQLPFATMINKSTYQQVLTHFNRENSIAPLLKKYRRAVFLKDTKSAIVLLRKISIIDEKNKTWLTDLAEFEKERQNEIELEFEDAQQKNNINQIVNLIIEMDEAGSSQTNPQLYQNLRDFLSQYERTELNHIIDGIITEIKDLIKSYPVAGEHESEKTYIQIIKKFQILLRHHNHTYAIPPDTVTSKINEIKKWIAAEQKKIAAKKIIKQQINSLNQAICQKHPEMINACINEIDNIQETISPELYNAALDVLAQEQRKKNKKKKMYYIFGTIAIICIIVLIGFYRVFQIKKEYLHQIELAVKNENLPIASKLSTILKNKYGYILSSEQNLQIDANLAKLEDKIKAKQAAFRLTFDRLSQYHTTGFLTTPEIIENLIDEAEINVVSNVDKARLNVIKKEWQTIKKASMRQYDEEALPLFNQVTNSLNKLKSLSLSNPERAIDEFNFHDQLLDQMQNYTQVSPQLKAQFDSLRNETTFLKTKLDTRMLLIKKIQSSTQLNDYLTHIISYTEQFPKDSISDGLKKIASLKPFYLALISSNVKDPEKDIFWQPLLNTLQRKEKKIIKNWPVTKMNIKEMKHNKWLWNLWQSNVKKPNQMPTMWFFEKQPQLTFINGVRSYSGNVYIPSIDDVQPEFAPHHIYESFLEDAKIMAHCQLLRDLVNKTRYSGMSPLKADIHLIGFIKKIYQKDIFPLLKLKLISFILKQLANLTDILSLNTWVEFQERLTQVESDVHWLCYKNPNMQPLNQNINSILQEYIEEKNIIGNYLMHSKINQIALSRKIIWVGKASLSHPLQTQFSTPNIPHELWKLSDIDNPKIEVFQNEAHINWIPGEPIFSTEDRKNTRSITQALFEKYKVEKENTNDWPRLWPSNIRKP